VVLLSCNVELSTRGLHNDTEADTEYEQAIDETLIMAMISSDSWIVLRIIALLLLILRISKLEACWHSVLDYSSNIP
jgi:hypothetical protein